MNCLHCGSPVLITDYCSNCGLKQEYLQKAFNSSNYYYNLGLDRAKVRDMTGAIEVLSLALKYNKRNTLARNLLGLVYYEMGELVEALSHWVISTHYDDDRNMATAYIREIQSSAGRINDINQLAKKYNQTLTYAAQNSKDLALIQLKKILAGHHHFVQGFLLLALLYIDSGNYDKAKKAIKRVLRIDKNNTLAIKYMYEMDASSEEVIALREKAANLDIESTDNYDEEVEESSDEEKDIVDILDNHLRELDIDDTSDKPSKFKTVNFSKYSLVYVVVGILVGGLSTWFLALPNKISKVQDMYSDTNTAYTDEISKKNLTISNLQANIEGLTAKNAELTDELDGSPEDEAAADAYEKLIAAYNYYEAEDKTNAASSLIGISRDAFTSDTTRGMYDTIANNCFAEVATTYYEQGKNRYGAGDYTGAVEALQKSYALNSESEDSLYYLVMSYELADMHDEASNYYNIFNEKYPDSEYQSSIMQYLQ